VIEPISDPNAKPSDELSREMDELLGNPADGTAQQ
jgi:hypothetical protein